MRCNEKPIIGKHEISLNTTVNVMKYFDKFDDVELVEGTIVIAKQQTGAVSEKGFKWISPLGGMYLAYNLGKKVHVTDMYFYYYANCLAIVDTLKYYGIEGKVKWYNDVYVNNKKIGTVLIKSEINNMYLTKMIVGIYINVNNSTKLLPEDVAAKATSLVDELGHEVDFHEFKQVLICNINKYLNILRSRKRKNYEQITEAWTKHSIHSNKSVIIRTYGGEEVSGVFSGLDPNDGEVLLKTGTGGAIKINSILEIINL
ncbi:MAG: biotin--[acetyl-CoA-carboxylase] ligase [Candidatus Njordarchaeia archaeon]